MLREHISNIAFTQVIWLYMHIMYINYTVFLYYSLQRPEFIDQRMKMGKAKSFNQLKNISQDLKNTLLVS